jgi:molybdenum cofactor cytidylyltransferase
MHITGIILAAGTSSRMGSANKLLLPYRGHTVIEEVLMQLSGSQVDDIVIVTGYERERVEDILADHLSSRIRLAYNDKFAMGRAESIRCAIEHISGKSDAALFMVADKPGVTYHLIDRAIDRFRRERPPILYVMTPNGRGHPIIFSKMLYPELLSLSGDRVGDDLVAKYKGDAVEVTDEKPQIDIDTEDDYRILLQNESEI